MTVLQLLLTLWMSFPVHNIPNISNQKILIEEKICSPDYEALKAFYRSTNGGTWTNKWDTTDCTVTGWYGVTKDDENRVQELVLDANHLSGSIPDELGNLESLTAFTLEYKPNKWFAPSWYWKT
ncbi:MAG: hypothetical protein IPI77_13885 [Saprospiraceae bacterium]|nr:hypothetical protein [Saprospiraceae bacterium]